MTSRLRPRTAFHLPSATDRPEATLTGPPRTPLGAAAPRSSALHSAAVTARFIAAALCALPLAACGGSSSGSDSGSSAPGSDVYRQYACAGCHSLDGSDGTGPTFKGLAGSTVKLDGGKEVKADAAYLERAITDPDADIVDGYNAGIMKASIDGFDLQSKPDDVKTLVEFIQGVK